MVFFCWGSFALPLSAEEDGDGVRMEVEEFDRVWVRSVCANFCLPLRRKLFFLGGWEGLFKDERKFVNDLDSSLFLFCFPPLRILSFLSVGEERPFGC